MLTTTTTSTDDHLARLSLFKSMMNITSSADDDLLDELILQASEAVATYIGYWPLRARYTETVAGYGNSKLMLSATPIRGLGAIYIGTQLVDPTTYYVDKPAVGLVHRDLGWPWTAGVEYDLEAHVVPKSEVQAFSVDYEAGWVLTTSTGDLTGDDFIASSGGRTLPRDFERGVLEQAKFLYLGRGRDSSIKDKRVGALSITYAYRGDVLEPLVSAAMALLMKYRRIK